MEITKEYLNQEIKNLEKAREQALADANACLGAITFATELIKKLEAPEDAPKSD